MCGAYQSTKPYKCHLVHVSCVPVKKTLITPKIPGNTTARIMPPTSSTASCTQNCLLFHLFLPFFVPFFGSLVLPFFLSLFICLYVKLVKKVQELAFSPVARVNFLMVLGFNTSLGVTRCGRFLQFEHKIWIMVLRSQGTALTYNRV